MNDSSINNIKIDLVKSKNSYIYDINTNQLSTQVKNNYYFLIFSMPSL